MEWESQVNDVYEVNLYVPHTIPFDGLNTMFTRTRSSPSLLFAELLLGVSTIPYSLKTTMWISKT